MLELGQRCFDIWISGDDSDQEGNKLLHNFDNVDRILLDMQQCIINALRPSSLAHKFFEERVKYKYKLSDCNCKTKILKLKEQIVTEKEKYQMLLNETAIFTQERLHLNTTKKVLEETFQYKEVLNRQNLILIKKLKQQLSDKDKELENLRFHFRTELANLKQGLSTVNRENFILRQQLLQIPVLEPNFDEERQMFILKIGTCQAKIKDLEKNFQRQKEDLYKSIEENQNLKRKLSQISCSENNYFKLKQIEHQQNLDILEESVAYFARRNSTLRQENRELKLKFNVNNSEMSHFEEELTTNDQETVEVPKLAESFDNNNIDQNIENGDILHGDDSAMFLTEKRKKLRGDKEEVSNDTNNVKEHSRTVSNP